MKKLSFLLLASFLLGLTVNAQEAGEVTLTDAEKANNARRKFCLPGNHEKAVNQLLLKAKERGAILTNDYVRVMCQKTDPKTPVEPE